VATEGEPLPLQTPAVRKSRKAVVKARFADEVRFLGSLLRAPRSVGAIAPTSSETAMLMASHIDLDSGLPVLELGPGTGAITTAILGTGLAPLRLYAVEYSAAFCRLLRDRFPGANFLQGDAFDLPASLGEAAPPAFDCVISGLPLLNFPKEKRAHLLQTALDLLEPGRPFVQFSYGIIPPIPLSDPSITVTKSRWIIRNVPPARVWVYRRKA
tara:strand:- start:31247 stop:31885 length:639 start_codon:yes stop_codon:yes gene_type:complete